MKRFRDPVSAADQLMWLPPTVDQFVAPDAPVRALSEVIDMLDLSGLYSFYSGGGAPAYDPKMLLKVLLFGYAEGLRSSRRMAQALKQDMRFMFLAQMSQPDFRTLCRFRRQHLRVIEDLFVQTVRLCQEMGLVLMEHVAVDGTKLEANVSGRNTYKRERLETELSLVTERIQKILEEAEDEDAREDQQFGQMQGDELPEELRDAKRRQELLKKAKEELDKSGRSAIAATDPQSRLMKTSSGNRPAYNAQAVVDQAHLVIVTAAITQEESDHRQLEPMLEQTVENTGLCPARAMADTGYASGEALAYAEKGRTEVYLKLGPESEREGVVYEPDADRFIDQNGQEWTFRRERVVRRKLYRLYRSRTTRRELWVPEDEAAAARMRAKLQTEEGRAVYRLRQQIVEPVFGHLKSVLGLRRLHLRGKDGAAIEYLLACCAYNLTKCIRHGQPMPA